MSRRKTVGAKQKQVDKLRIIIKIQAKSKTSCNKNDWLSFKSKEINQLPFNMTIRPFLTHRNGSETNWVTSFLSTKANKRLIS